MREVVVFFGIGRRGRFLIRRSFGFYCCVRFGWGVKIFVLVWRGD